MTCTFTTIIKLIVCLCKVCTSGIEGQAGTKFHYNKISVGHETFKNVTLIMLPYRCSIDTFILAPPIPTYKVMLIEFETKYGK